MRGTVVGAAIGIAAYSMLLAGPVAAAGPELYNEYGPQFENCNDGSLARAIKDGITLGESNVAPHSMLDPATNKASGIDVEINQAIADWLGIKNVKYEWIPWAEEVPSLLSKRTDVIAQNIHVNPDRVKVISFSGPAWWYGPVVLVEKGNPDGIKSYEDLKGKDVGASGRLRRRGLSAPDRRQHHHLQVRGRGAASLNQGRVKYVVEDDVVFTEFDKATPGNKIEALWDIAAPTDVIYGGGYGARATGSARRIACCARPTASPWASCATTARSARS